VACALVVAVPDRQVKGAAVVRRHRRAWPRAWGL